MMMSKPSRRVVFAFREEDAVSIETLVEQGRAPASLLNMGAISFVADSPVKTSVLPEEAKVSTEQGLACGQSLPGSFAFFDLATSLWRTHQRSFFGGWEEFSAIWPRAGMTRNGTAFLLPPLALPIFDTGASSWPTPTANDARNSTLPPSLRGRDSVVGKILRMDPTLTCSDRPCEGNVRLYRNQVLAGLMTEEEAESLLGKSPFEAQGKLRPMEPTPRTDSRDNCGGSNALKVALRNGTYIGRALNPEWQEWLMGFPIGHTELEPSEMP